MCRGQSHNSQLMLQILDTGLHTHNFLCAIMICVARHFSCGSPLQEASGYFFCLEDRALLCRDCDVAIHTVNPFVSAHQRFLLTGVQVGLDPADPVPPVADKHANAGGDSVYKPTKNLSRKSPTVPSSGESSDSVPSENVIRGDYCRQNYVPTVRNGVVNWTMNNSTIPSLEPQSEYMSDESLALLQCSLATSAFANQINKNNDQACNLLLLGGNGSENLPDWPVDEFFSSSEFGPNFSFAEHCSSKVNCHIVQIYLCCLFFLNVISILCLMFS
jgi:hypothetical protein